jgi:hypothetical protein
MSEELDGATCLGCNETGEVAEDHGYGAVEYLGCQDCMGTGLAPASPPATPTGEG